MALVTCATAGPGATVALGWLWREEMLADKKMKGALVEGSWEAQGMNGSAKEMNGKAKGMNGHVAKRRRET